MRERVRDHSEAGEGDRDAGVVPVVAIVLLLFVTVAASAGVYAWSSTYRLHERAPGAIGLTAQQGDCTEGVVLVSSAHGQTKISEIRIEAGEATAYTISYAGRIAQDEPWRGDGLDGIVMAGDVIEARVTAGDDYTFYVVHDASGTVLAQFETTASPASTRGSGCGAPACNPPPGEASAAPETAPESACEGPTAQTAETVASTSSP